MAIFANKDVGLVSNLLAHWNQPQPCIQWHYGLYRWCDDDERWIQSLKGVNCTFSLHKRLVFHGTFHIDCPIAEWYDIGYHYLLSSHLYLWNKESSMQNPHLQEQWTDWIVGYIRGITLWRHEGNKQTLVCLRSSKNCILKEGGDMITNLRHQSRLR